MSITFTSLNKLALPDKLFSRILIHTTSKPQTCHQSERLNDCFGLLTQFELGHAIGVLSTFSFFADDAHLDNLRKSTRDIS